MTNKTQLNARVRFIAGPAEGSYGRIAAFNESTWQADVAMDDGRTARNVPMKLLVVIEEDVITDREKLLDRIRKLHAKAESCKAMGSEAEAATFAASVQKMLNKYRLEMSEVEFTAFETAEPIERERITGEGKRHRVLWAESLADVIARAHFCRLLVLEQSDTIILVGRKTDRTVAAFVIQTLRRFAEESSDREARAFRKQQRAQFGETSADARNFRTAWLASFVNRIAERYREEAQRRDAEAKTTGTSLIRLTNADAQLTQFMREVVKPRAARRLRGRSSANHAGHEAGRAAGSRVNIRSNAIDAGGTLNVRRLPS